MAKTKKVKVNLHEMDTAALDKQLVDVVAQLNQAYADHSAGKLKNTASLKHLRKQVARIKAVHSEKVLV